MKFWIRGERWRAGKVDALQEFPIRTQEFKDNDLVVPHQLNAEGFPSPWGQALEFAARIEHHFGNITRKPYREACEAAVLDLITLVTGQFLGLLVPYEYPWTDGSEAIATSSFGRLLRNTLIAEGRAVPALVVLRDSQMAREPVVAINHPDCLWFPVQSYRGSALGTIRGRIEKHLGRLHLKGIEMTEDPPSLDARYAVGQFRSYLRRISQMPTGSDKQAWQRVLETFEVGLKAIADEEYPDPITAGRAYVSAPGQGAEAPTTSLKLSSLGHIDEQDDPTVQEWMNFSYPGGPLVLEGGDQPRTTVWHPAKEGQEIQGWEHLKERGLFFDEAAKEYIIWEDDSEDLPRPPNTKRIRVSPRRNGRGSAFFRVNRAEIEVRGRLLRRSDVLLHHVYQMPPGTGFAPLPVRGDLAACLDWERGGIIPDLQKKGRWKVYLRGGWDEFFWEAEQVSEPSLQMPENVTLLVWPGFQDPDWQADTVVYYLSTLASKTPVRTRCWWKDPSGTRRCGELLGRSIEDSLRHLDGRLEALEWITEDGEPMGYFRPQRETLPAKRDKKAEVSLDFGTSNSVLVWRTERTEIQEIAVDRTAPPLEIVAPQNETLRDSVAQKLSLLPIWPQRESPYWCIPSEIVPFEEAQPEFWTIPHEEVADPAIIRNLARDFKWHDREDVNRREYLDLILRMALANLRSQGVSSVDLRVTYPLAFERNHLDTYHKILNGTNGRLQALSKATAMDINLVGYASESIAGLMACRGTGGTIHCVIDFGGGTTDIAVQLIGQSAGTTLKPLFVDSLRLAGNDVLASLLADPELCDSILEYGGFSAKGDRDESWRQTQARQIILRDLRSSGSTGLPNFWNRLVGERPGPAERFSNRNRSLFDGVLAYVVVLLSEAEQSWRENQPKDAVPEISIFLLGQGWGLLHLQSGKGSHKPTDYVKKRLEELRQKIADHGGSYPKIRVFDPGDNVKSQPKLATSFGALMLPSEKVRPCDEAGDIVGRETIFGLDVEFIDGHSLTADSRLDSPKRSRIQAPVKSHNAWKSFIEPLLKEERMTEHVRELFGADDKSRMDNINTWLNKAIEQRLGEQLQEEGPLRSSALGVLLEDIWTQQLRKATPLDD